MNVLAIKEDASSHCSSVWFNYGYLAVIVFLQLYNTGTALGWDELLWVQSGWQKHGTKDWSLEDYSLACSPWNAMLSGLHQVSCLCNKLLLPRAEIPLKPGARINLPLFCCFWQVLWSLWCTNNQLTRFHGPFLPCCSEVPRKAKCLWLMAVSPAC